MPTRKMPERRPKGLPVDPQHPAEPDQDLGSLTDRRRFKDMVRWFTPGLLAQAGFHSVVAGLFGQYADQRTTQHLTDPIPDQTDPVLRKRQQGQFASRYDYSGEKIGSDPFWVDYASDMGDGFDPTYAMAHMISADHLYPEKKAVGLNANGMEVYGLNGGEALPGGRLLVLGGDEVYPWPSREEYEDRFCRPYRLAYPAEDKSDGSPDAARGAVQRDMFAIPGNHDWYDGLAAFDDLFCRARGTVSEGRQSNKIGGWQTRQHRSYFAIKLPHNWWIWGADIQLGRYLDTGQLDYFRTVAEHMEPGAKFILCTAQPSWYYFGTDAESLARSNLRDLIDTPIKRGAKLCGIFSGDSHHYSRYTETDKLGNFNLITAGGGGAYAHGTYHLRPKIGFHWVDRVLEFTLNCKLKPARPNMAARAAARVAPKTPAKPASQPMDFADAAERPAQSLGAAAVTDVNVPNGASNSDALPDGAAAFVSAPVPEPLEASSISSHLKPKQTTGAAAYPNQTISRILAWSNFGFPFRNPSFALAIGMIYLLLTWTFSVLDVSYRINVSPDEISKIETIEYDKLVRNLDKRGGIPNLPQVDGSAGPPPPANFTERKPIESWTLDILDIFLSAFESSASYGEAAMATLVFFGRSLQLLLLGIVYSLPAMMFMLAMLALFITIAQTRFDGRLGTISRVALGTFHFALHLVMMWALYAAFLGLNHKWLKPAIEAVDTDKNGYVYGLLTEFWVRAASVPEMIFGGMLMGGLLFGLYLTCGYHFAKINADWVFSSQRLKGYKCFLRMKFEPDQLTIYPIGLHKVPSSGRFRSAWFSQKPDMTTRSLLRPFRKLKPHLIEGPIVIRAEDVRNIPRD